MEFDDLLELYLPVDDEWAVSCAGDQQDADAMIRQLIRIGRKRSLALTFCSIV